MYRTSAWACPSCKNAVLREFNQRYACDECEGLLVGVDDFVKTMEDVDGGSDAITFDNDKESDLVCPLCPKKLLVGRLMRAHTLMTGVAHCTEHGIWFGNGQLAGFIATTSRRAHGNVGEGRTYGGVGGARGPAGLAVSKWWNKPKPRVHTAMTSRFAGEELSCPTCDTKLAFIGDRWACDACTGSFVETGALDAMVSEMSKELWHLPDPVGDVGPRVCPACKAKMVLEKLEGVTIDRCGDHGVWFDEGELAEVLEHVANPHTHVTWLRRLFGRRNSQAPENR